MNLQFISDSSGKTTGVFIPINDWNELKIKYKGIEQDEINIPTWQVNEVRNRMDDYRTNPTQSLDFDAAIDELEKDL